MAPARGLASIVAALAVGSNASTPPSPAITTVYPVAGPRGVMVTSGGWAYCLQVQGLARRVGYTLICGRYSEDGYTGYGLRSQRHLDWGNPAYLAAFAARIQALHRRVGGSLVLIGVSYSGFGVATLAAHHPELRPDRLIVIDSYLDLVARRQALASSDITAQDIDQETGGSEAALRDRSATPQALARLVREGTRLTVIWSVSPLEKAEFQGATCDLRANAETLSELADTLGRPVPAWVTENRHGHDLWDHGFAIFEGRIPGRGVLFQPGGAVPPAAFCA